MGTTSRLDLVVVAFLTLLAVAQAFLWDTIVLVRLAIALPLVTLFPGYAITAAAFPKLTLGLVERIVFSLGISLGTSSLGALILNWTPWGLQSRSWAVLLGIVSLGGCAVAVKRRGDERWIGTLRVGTGLGFRQVVLLLLGLILMTGAAGVSYISAGQPTTPGFTQLWMLPSAGSENNAVSLGVKNMEGVALTYRLQLLAGGTTVREWAAIELTPGGEWGTTVQIPSIQLDDAEVEARLFRKAGPGIVYRQVKLSQGWRSR